MSNDFREQIHSELNLRETEDLLEIWNAHDQEEWSDTAFEVIKVILEERLGEVPPREVVSVEQNDNSSVNDDGLEEWEGKLLDSEDQPEFYDTLEVLELKNNINKVAIMTVVIYTLLCLLRLQVVSTLLQGVPISFAEVVRLLPADIFTILTYGLQILLVYYPLKALSHVLRILMEMEFRSRKAN